MEKSVIAAASYYSQKYFINPEYNDLPTEIRNELRIITILLSEKLHCIVSIGFYDDGDLYFETEAEDGDYHYDEIGAALEIKKLKSEKLEMIESLQLWYRVYRFDK